jgi:hypothetical protein
MPADDAARFKEWAGRWLTLAKYPGDQVPDPAGRIADVLTLWREAVPPGWERDDDTLLLDPAVRYRRTHAGRPDGPVREALIEQEILAPDPAATATVCLGGRLVDGINALSLQKNRYRGGRGGNVEADMLLLVRDEHGYRALVVEVKHEDGTAWYAAVENLREVRLYSVSAAAQRVLRTRRPDLDLPDELPATSVVLAPAAYYTAPGKRANSVAPARALLDRMRDEEDVDGVLATWDSDHRIIEPVV